MRLSEIAGAVGSSVSFDAPVRSVVTDSRKACAGTVFVAIRGEALDGNDFAAQALANGAEAAVVERRMPGADPARCILVPDGKRALIKIGGAYRSRFQIPFVGVTGSVGKTTTKEFIHAVLSAKYHTLKNEGNQNNEIGVPNTLFNLTPRHETAVIEMGMSGFGEIRDLTLAVRPSVGVITSIGVSHIEMLGSRENILKAKLELLEGMPDGAPLLLCGDNDLLAAVRSDRLRVCRYGMENQDCQIRAVNVEQHGEDSTSFVIASPWGSHAASIPIIGRHNVLDALAAFGTGCLLGIEPAAAAAALSSYRSTGMRQKQVPWHGATIVEDCYNCSPDSLRAAALTLAAYPCRGKRVLVLSDMLELGENAAAMHRECGAFIARQEIDLLMACGPLSSDTIEGADRAGMERCCHYPDQSSMAEALLHAIRPGDVVWFKASRGMKLEDVIHTLYRKGESL